ncbi:SLC13 family permease [bacterium]|nr:SLC13 family permease [bacterium]
MRAMDPHGWIAIAILALAALVFLRKWAPTEVVALAIPVLLSVTGVLPDPLVALQGFGNHTVIALGAIFVVGAGLRNSGLAALAARAILRLSGGSHAKILALLMAATASASAFMSNAACVALFLPTAVTISRRSMIPSSQLLLPMASAAVLGGTLTAIGTPPNLLASDYLAVRTGEPFSIFRFAVIGIPIVAMGILYTITIGRHLLPKRGSEDRLREARLPAELAQSYQITRNLCQMKVLAHSSVVNQTIREAAIRNRHGLAIVLVRRHFGVASRYLHPRPDLRLRDGDVLYLEGPDEAAWEFAEEEGLQFGLAGPQVVERILGRGNTLAEVLIAPRSPIVGRSLRDLRFRDRYGLNALSLWRAGKPVPNPAAIPLEVGDAFLVSGPVASVRELSTDPDYIVLSDQSEAIDIQRAPLAFLLLLVAIVPPILGIMPLAISAVAAALLMLLTRCIGLEEARRSIEWKVVFLIAGTLPLGIALETTGVAGTVAHGLLNVTLPMGEPAVLSSLFLLAAVTATSSSNSAAAVIIMPIAGEVASAGAVGLEHALLAVAYGCSCAFVLPIAQWNLMVMAPGDYQPRDFVRFGAGLSLAMGVATVGLLSLW